MNDSAVRNAWLVGAAISLAAGCGDRGADFMCEVVDDAAARTEIEAEVLSYTCGNYGNRYHIGRPDELDPPLRGSRNSSPPYFIRTCVLGEVALKIGPGDDIYIRAENAETRTVKYFRGSGEFDIKYKDNKFYCAPHTPRPGLVIDCRPVGGAPVHLALSRIASNDSIEIYGASNVSSGGIDCGEQTCALDLAEPALLKVRYLESGSDVYLRTMGRASISQNANGGLSCGPGA